MPVDPLKCPPGESFVGSLGQSSGGYKEVHFCDLEGEGLNDIHRQNHGNLFCNLF